MTRAEQAAQARAERDAMIEPRFTERMSKALVNMPERVDKATVVELMRMAYQAGMGHAMEDTIASFGRVAEKLDSIVDPNRKGGSW